MKILCDRPTDAVPARGTTIQLVENIYVAMLCGNENQWRCEKVTKHGDLEEPVTLNGGCRSHEQGFYINAGYCKFLTVEVRDINRRQDAQAIVHS